MKSYEIRMAVYEWSAKGFETIRYSRITEDGYEIDDEPKIPLDRLTAAMEKFMRNYGLKPSDNVEEVPFAPVRRLEYDSLGGSWKYRIEQALAPMWDDKGIRKVVFVIPLGQYSEVRTQDVIRFAKRFKGI